MENESNHSQDYDRKHGNDHVVKDKAALKEEFIDKLRKDADGNDADEFNPTPAEGK